MTSSIRLGSAPADDPRELVLGQYQALADTLAQLAGRDPCERDQQQLIERHDALGDEAGGERGDRERLARAGARLEYGDARRQLAAELERLRVESCLDAGHQPSTTSRASSGCQIVIASSASRSISSSAPSASTCSGSSSSRSRNP